MSSASNQGNALYSMVVRVCGIFAVTLMAIVDDMNHFYNNDIWYAGVVGAMVIGPHLLDRVANLGDTTASRQVPKIQILFAGMTILVALARFTS